MTKLTLPKWFDLHTHFRQGAAVSHYIQAHLDMGCAGALAMPNTQPPVAQVTGAEGSIESYRAELVAAGADAFEQLIIPLYLTAATTPEMISEPAVKACKYYPPHGTTNSEHGQPMAKFIGGEVFRAMEEQGVILCIHGEQHALSGPDYIDRNRSAEATFYRETMPRLLEAHPKLRIVCEHVTTQEAVDFVRTAGLQVGATITPQHLLFTIAHLIQGLKYHLFCLPVVKFEDDREALRQAVLEVGQTQFFAGTDSAPHTTKMTPCGCAAGCFTGGCAPQLYAMAFEEAGDDLSDPKAFRAFLCENGPHFYGFEPSVQMFDLFKQPQTLSPLETPAGPVTPLPVGLELDLTWSISPESSH